MDLHKFSFRININKERYICENRFEWCIMKKLKYALTPILALALLISMSACSVSYGKYKVIDELLKYELCVGFRQGDKAGQAVIAAMKELQAEGTVDDLSREWFGNNLSTLEGDKEAIENLGFEVEKRDCLIGYDVARMPFSGKDKRSDPIGFDIDFAKAVCKKLGWQAKFIPVDVANAEVELNSGNVDCIWGAFPYSDTYESIDTSPTYMENTIVIATLNSSNMRSMKSLSGKTLMLSESNFFEEILEENSDLQSKPEFIVRVPGGTVECIETLNDCGCDAIITDELALNYYR